MRRPKKIHRLRREPAGARAGSEQAFVGNSGENLESTADADVGEEPAAFAELDFGDAVGGFGGFQIGKMPIDARSKIGGIEMVRVRLAGGLALVRIAPALEMVVHAEEVNLVEAHEMGELDGHIGDGGPVPETVMKVVVEAWCGIVLEKEGERVGAHIVAGIEAQKLRHGQGRDVAAELGEHKGVHGDKKARQKAGAPGEKVNAVEPEGLLAPEPAEIHLIEAGPVSQNKATLAGVGIAEPLEAPDVFQIAPLQARGERWRWLRNL